MAAPSASIVSWSGSGQADLEDVSGCCIPMCDNRVVCRVSHLWRGRYSVVRSHAHFGAWYSRFPGTGPAPADTARGQLMGSCFFVRGGVWGAVHAPISYAARSDGVCWRRLQAVQCQSSLAGNQTLAAMSLCSEAQGKAKSTEFAAKRSTRCCAGSGRGALELACFALVSFSR